MSCVWDRGAQDRRRRHKQLKHEGKSLCQPGTVQEGRVGHTREGFLLSEHKAGLGTGDRVRALAPFRLAVSSPSGILQPCCWNSDDHGYSTEGPCQSRELHDGSSGCPSVAGRHRHSTRALLSKRAHPLEIPDARWKTHRVAVPYGLQNRSLWALPWVVLALSPACTGGAPGELSKDSHSGPTAFVWGGAEAELF